MKVHEIYYILESLDKINDMLISPPDPSELIKGKVLNLRNYVFKLIPDPLKECEIGNPVFVRKSP